MNHTISLPQHFTYYQGILAVELAAILGFEQESIDFPMLRRGGDIVIAPAGAHQSEGFRRKNAKLYIYAEESRSSVDRICRTLLEHTEEYLHESPNERESPLPDGYHASSDHPKPVGSLHRHTGRGLESLFEIGSFFGSQRGEWLPDQVFLKIRMSEDLSLSQIIAACNFAARIGAETLTLTYPLTAETDDGISPLLRFSAQGSLCISMDENTRKVITVSGDGKQLEQFSVFFCNSFPRTAPGQSWSDFLRVFEDGLAFQTLDGQITQLEASGARDAECYFSLGCTENPALAKRFPYAHFHDYKGHKKVFEESYSLPWEVDVCRDVLETKVYPLLKPGDSVNIQIVLSEDRSSRDKLAAEIANKLNQKGITSSHVDVLCAYKQGFCWIDEKVLPALESCGEKPVDIEIAFRPFLPPDGIPWMDLPIRFLQELYPIDDIIADRLGICRDCIRFVEYSGDQNVTYTFRAFSETGDVLFFDSYRVSFTERRYLDAFPETALVHPSTGAIRVTVNGSLVLEERIETDLERIWEIYQGRVLPYCRDYIEDLCGGNPQSSMQPFFSQLRLDIQVSEPDVLLPCRQDMISSIDAFHEDLYFAGLDFFNLYGKQSGDVCLDSPGLVLPVIHQAEGKPSMTFTLFSQLRQSPALFVDGVHAAQKISGTASLRAIRNGRAGTEAVINVSSKSDLTGYLCAYSRLLSEGILDAANQLEGFSSIVFELNGSPVASAILPQKHTNPSLDIDEIDLMEDRIIGYDEYLAIIDQLKRVSGIEVYELSESYQGRKIHAIELSPTHGSFQSRLKRINLNPTKLVVARHHANEISATNGCFMFLRELLQNPKYHGIGNQLNIVLLPFENPDGAAIHYMLQQEHPNWKFHIARYNSLGKEFSREYFKDDTIHTEALAFTRIYRKWMPDFVVENHGVPSHEWDQQFSGYTSPMYRGYWLPRALLYSYFWMIDHPDYSANLPLNDQMENAVAQSLLADDEIMQLNRDWKDRFEKYAHRWMPELFPAEYCQSMISYKQAFPYRSNNYVSVCYPWITAVEFMSEVSDETASGAYLKLCARTHLIHDIATTDLLLKSKCAYQRTLTMQNGEVHKTYRRLRPFILP